MQSVLQRKYMRNAAGLSVLDKLLNLACLTNSVTKIIKLSSAYTATASDLDVVQLWRVDREGTLYAYAVGNTTDGEGLSCGTVLAGDNSAFKSLKSLTGSLNYLNEYLNGVANLEIRNVVTKLFSLNGLYNGHNSKLLSPKAFVLP